MIKLPKEVAKIMRTLNDAGYECFNKGDCVKEFFAGQKSEGWDVVTNAQGEDLFRLFPDAKVLSRKYGVLRMEFIEELYDEEGAFAGEDGIIVDVASYRIRGAKEGEYILTDSIEKVLEQEDFTINAIADSPTKILDPYNGRDDIRKKLIRSIGPAEQIFKNEPIKMFSAIRYAAELGFDLTKEVYEAITANYQLLAQEAPEKIRDEFTKTLCAANAGKGLNMIMDTGILKIILGEQVTAHLTRREKSDLLTLAGNIDKTHRVEARRLGLFYTCISKRKAMPSVEKLCFEPEIHQHLVDALRDMAKLYFTARPQELKKFVYDRGWERYNYLANLEKAQRIVHNYYSDTKIQSKMYMLGEIRKKNEPIFIEDMVVDANDLIEAGICTTETVDKMLVMLIETLHHSPELNTRNGLLALAKKYKRFKILALTRGVKWMR